jgi:hypothetical protein
VDDLAQVQGVGELVLGWDILEDDSVRRRLVQRIGGDLRGVSRVHIGTGRIGRRTYYFAGGKREELPFLGDSWVVHHEILDAGEDDGDVWREASLGAQSGGGKALRRKS